MKFIFSTAILLTIVCSEPVSAEYLTYSEWASLPSAARAYYISGSFDALTGVVNGPREKYQKHYVDCVRDRRIENLQLSKDLRSFAGPRPAVQERGVIGALIIYLVNLCGPVPAN